MTLQSSAFADGGQIPIKHTQAGEEASPALAWSNAPEGVASYVLIVHDVDAAIGPGTDDILQWMLWNIPPTATSLLRRTGAQGRLDPQLARRPQRSTGADPHAGRRHPL